MDHIPEVLKVLFVKRAIQPQAMGHVAENFRAGLVADKKVDRIAQDARDQKGDGGDSEEHQADRAQAFESI